MLRRRTTELELLEDGLATARRLGLVELTGAHAEPVLDSWG
jgi:hypothetical protein